MTTRQNLGYLACGAALGVVASLAVSHVLKRPNDEAEEDEKNDVPENAPTHCPGTQSKSAGKESACAGCPNQQICASGEARKPDPAVSEVGRNLMDVKNKIIVLSGKGGVGKSTVSCQLAWALASQGYDVGLLDVDICGPSIPKMLGVVDAEVHASGEGWSPVYVDEKLSVMSIAFLLPGQDDAIIWRGPKKNGLIRQFLTDVQWGALDFLIVDTPPGTSDEHLSVLSYLKEAKVDGAVVVTTPQEVSLQDVRKELNFCKKLELPVLGVVENMSDSVFSPSDGREGTKEMCTFMEVPYVGSIPLDREVTLASEEGRQIHQGTGSYGNLQDVIAKILTNLKSSKK